MVDQLVNLLENYVFPIAMCFLMLWKMEKDQERYREDLNSMRNVIEQNTAVMTEIKTMITFIKDGD